MEISEDSNPNLTNKIKYESYIIDGNQFSILIGIINE
jgi:hypothetical protein